MIVSGIQKSSLIDYPEKISAIIFTQGCNFRCPYCHNPELILNKCDSSVEVSRLFDFLKSRIGKLDGVVITGGEPTLHNDLPEFISQIKEMGYFVKLDTNGTNPNMLNHLLVKKLIDYVAMDIKAPLNKYKQVTQSNICTKEIEKSINIINESCADSEFRTTVVKEQLLIEDFSFMGEMIKGAKKYYLQKFSPTKTLDNSFLQKKTYSENEFAKIMQVLEPYVQNVFLR